jgi:hypothetical protein
MIEVPGDGGGCTPGTFRMSGKQRTYGEESEKE